MQHGSGFDTMKGREGRQLTITWLVGCAGIMLAVAAALLGVENGTYPMENLSVALVPIGRVEDVSLKRVGEAVEEVLPVTCRVHSEVEASRVGYDTRREQFLASALIEHFAPAKPTGADLAIFVTEEDLYEGDLNFVLGLADTDSGCCIISPARMRLGMPGPGLLQDRANKTAVHELGHLFGLGHCPNRECVMTFSNTVGETDRKRCWLCDDCRKRL